MVIRSFDTTGGLLTSFFTRERAAKIHNIEIFFTFHRKRKDIYAMLTFIFNSGR